MRRPSPGLYSSVLHILSNTDSRSHSITATMNNLIDHLTAEEAECLPMAIGGVLGLLRREPERLRFAAEIVARFDFFEAARELADVALATDDRELLLAAATVCGNPSVEAPIRELVAEAVADDPAGLIRLDHRAVPGTADEKSLYWQRWPGARTDARRFALAPVIVLDQGFEADAALRLAVRLDEAGASVRRIAPGAPIPKWFGPQTVLFCLPRTRRRVLNRYPGFSPSRVIVENMPTDNRSTAKLLHKINAVLPEPQKLWLAALSPEVTTDLWSPDVFTAGVYSTRDVSFLAGTTTSSLNYMRKRRLITPRELRNPKALRWTFRDLVAVRTWAYLNSVSHRRVSSSVVTALSRFAGDTKAVQLGATSDGHVFVDRGDGWIDVETGQVALDLPITDIDAVFRPFEYGRSIALDLLQASPNTRLHPMVLNGTPHLNGHRISAKALASVDRLCRPEAIESAYPELKGIAYQDTVSIGCQILLTR